MKNLLDQYFGSEATLKREAVIIILFCIVCMVVMIYGFTKPADVVHYERITDSLIFWLSGALLGIFGIQVAPSMLNKTSTTTAKVETAAGGSVETAVTTSAPAAEKPLAE